MVVSQSAENICLKITDTVHENNLFFLEKEEESIYQCFIEYTMAVPKNTTDTSVFNLRGDYFKEKEDLDVVLSS